MTENVKFAKLLVIARKVVSRKFVTSALEIIFDMIASVCLSASLAVIKLTPKWAVLKDTVKDAINVTKLAIKRGIVHI